MNGDDNDSDLSLEDTTPLSDDDRQLLLEDVQNELMEVVAKTWGEQSKMKLKVDR